MKEITDLLNAIAPYLYLVAIVWLAIKGWLKKYHPDIAAKTDALDKIAENIVAQEAVLDKTNAERKESAVDAVLEQAAKFKIPTTKANAAGAVEKAYNKVKPLSDDDSDAPSVSLDDSDEDSAE